MLESLYITAATLKALSQSDGRMTYIKGRIDVRRGWKGQGQGEDDLVTHVESLT